MKRLTVVYEVPDDYNVTRITGTGELEVVRCESMDVMQELGKVTARLAAAEEAARWCYHILVDNQDLSHFYATDQWPWLADEAKGGRDERPASST